MVIIFDVDGTLIDTFPHVRASYIHVLEKFFPGYQYTEEQLKSFFGPTLPDTFRTFTENEEFVRILVDKYVSHSRTIVRDYISVFPDTIETLERLKEEGYPLAVLSNKRTQVIKDQFSLLGILDYFDLIIGYNDVKNPKPDPEGIRKIQSKLGKNCLFIGDTVYDIKTAKNAGVTSIGVLWALASEADLRNAGADYIINDYQEFFEILRRLK